MLMSAAYTGRLEYAVLKVVQGGGKAAKAGGRRWRPPPLGAGWLAPA